MLAGPVSRFVVGYAAPTAVGVNCGGEGHHLPGSRAPSPPRGFFLIASASPIGYRRWSSGTEEEVEWNEGKVVNAEFIIL
jgi:hypothetical protein